MRATFYSTIRRFQLFCFRKSQRVGLYCVVLFAASPPTFRTVPIRSELFRTNPNPKQPPLLQPGRDCSRRVRRMLEIARDSSSRHHPGTRPVSAHLGLSRPISGEIEIPDARPHLANSSAQVFRNPIIQ